jgi:hypothetical protein
MGECFMRLLIKLGISDKQAVEEEVRESALVEMYADTFIKVKGWEAFHESDIGENKIYGYCSTVPGFVAELEQELDRKPGVSPDVCYFVSLTIL